MVGVPNDRNTAGSVRAPDGVMFIYFSCSFIREWSKLMFWFCIQVKIYDGNTIDFLGVKHTFLGSQVRLHFHNFHHILFLFTGLQESDEEVITM